MADLTAEAPPRRVSRYQLDTAPGRLTPEQSAAKGKATRTAAPRASHARRSTRGPTVPIR
jgi:hypothetical protein